MKKLAAEVKQYLLITANYWAFTLTDGALRMLIVLYFYQLGFGALEIAMLFLFYEFFGVVTNFIGGWLGARIGLNKIMNIGLGLQIAALAMLLVPVEYLSVGFVMAVQALSGIAKDLNKMSAKSAIKLLVAQDAQTQLFRWVALLTGSKNTLKGVGFFLGGALLSVFGFTGAILAMFAMLSMVWLLSLMTLQGDLGRVKNKPKFKDLFAKSAAINWLSAARLFLFGARDVWFVVALPVYLASTLAWDHWSVGAFMASWVIGYGVVQSISPYITGRSKKAAVSSEGATKLSHISMYWSALLMCIPALIAIALSADFYPQYSLVIGLLVFGVIFAINSSLHSYLIVRYASADGVSMDVGFYYTANAMGRLIGTVLSGAVFQFYGLVACLWVSAAFLGLVVALCSKLPENA
jgi:hypothetical protein